MADLTVTIADEYVARIKAMVGAKPELIGEEGTPRDATADEVIVYIKRSLRADTMAYERQASKRTIEAQVAAAQTAYPQDEYA